MVDFLFIAIALGNLRLLPRGYHELCWSHRDIYVFYKTQISLQFPKVCREEVSIHVIQSRDHILNTVSFSIVSIRKVVISSRKLSTRKKYLNLQKYIYLTSLTVLPF